MGPVALAWLCLHSAWAGDDDGRARELYENGAILYEEGRYEDAVAAFSEAYRLSGRPALLYNIANAQERLGLWTEAHETLSRYRAYAEADERETLDRRIFNLERRMAEAPAPVERAAVQSSTSAQSPWLQPLPLALGGGGVALVVTGGVLGAIAIGNRGEATAACATDGDGALRCPESASDAVGADVGFSLAADVAFLLGAVGVGTGVGFALWGEGGVLSVGPGYAAISGEF